MDTNRMRLGLYRKIEVARKQLPEMDEEAFRDLLRSEFGVGSRKDMNTTSSPGWCSFLPKPMEDSYRASQKP